MKKFLKAVLIIVIFTLIIAFLEKYKFKGQDFQLKDTELKLQLKYKGVQNAVDFVVDGDGNYYVAFKDKVQFIDNQGKSYNIFKKENMDISSIEYYKNKLYLASNSSVFSYDLHKKELNEIIVKLPNFGDYNKSIIRIYEDYLYVTLGAATNSGVVGEDNSWTKEFPFSYDISPYRITLKGINFNEGKTGAFASYGTKNIEGQIVSGHFPGNASIIIYNIQNTSTATFAWGIRNVKGMDFDSRGRIIAAVGGMEDRGLRGVKGDTDYIYIIKSKNWYGWPDYSGGDPISSPRFKSSNNKPLTFILDNHPTTNPSAPLYVHKNLASLKAIAVDKEGTLGEPDSIYFQDGKENVLFSLNQRGILSKKVEFNSSNKISSIKYVKNQIIILESNEGKIYSLEKAK